MTRSVHPYDPGPSQLGELFLPRRRALSRPRRPPRRVLARPLRPVADGRLRRPRGARAGAWNLEYRRVGAGGGWPETFLDVAAGVDLLAELDAPLDLERVVAVGTRPVASSRSGRPLGRTCRRTPGVDPRVSIGAAVSQAGVLDLTLAAGLTRRRRRPGPCSATRGQLRALRPRLAARAPPARSAAARPPRGARRHGVHAHRDELRGRGSERGRPVRAPRALAHRPLRAHRRGLGGLARRARLARRYASAARS